MIGSIIKRLFNMHDTTIQLKRPATIKINGRQYAGQNIVVSGNNTIVQIDGKEVEVKPAPCLEITVHGNVDEITTANGNITVNGNVGGDIETVNGNIHCQDISGKIDTVNGDVTCRDVRGGIETITGDVKYR